MRASSVFGGREEYQFWQCEKCDAVYLFPFPSQEQEDLFYRNEFSAFMSKRSGGDRDWSNAEAHIKSNQDQIKRRWPFLEEYIRPGMKLLEIGCSSGFMLDAFIKHGLDCVGVDPSGEFSDFLKRKGRVIFQSLNDLSADERFDLIVHFFVFEHIRDPFTFLARTYGLLQPKGTMIFEIPCVNDPLTSLYTIPAFEKFYWSMAHHYYYSPKSMAYVLDKMGFDYELVPEQRYDLSNHITWMTEGKPGGQGKYAHVFSSTLLEQYKHDLKKQWLCDTIFVRVYKKV